MFVNKNYHFFLLLNKFNFNLKFNTIKYGTNSKNFFLFIKKKFFLSFVKIKIIKILTLKILQNNLLLPTSKILTNKKKIIFYKKNIGKMLFFPCINKITKICFFLKKNIFKKYNKKNNKIKIFFLKINRNFISKIFYLKKKKKNTNFINHNDLFKDNNLFYGNVLSSIIDFANFNYVNYYIDFSILKLEFSFNYLINKSIIKNLENNKKNKSLNFCIFMFIISRTFNLVNFKKTKSYNSYKKKIFYD